MAIEQQGTHGVIGDDMIVLRALYDLKAQHVSRDQLLSKLTTSGLERQYQPEQLDKVLNDLAVDMSVLHDERGLWKIGSNGVTRLGPLVERSLGSLDGPRDQEPSVEPPR